MKHAVFIGNCQCSGLRAILEYTNFNEKYTVKQYANWQMIENHEAPPIKDLAEADVVIYQPLSDVHGCFSTDPTNPHNMLHACKPDAQILSFPRLHNNSLWPIYKKHNQKQEYYGGDFLAYYEGQHIRTMDQFLYLFDQHIMDFRMKDRFQQNMAITQKKEESTTVKVHTFILSSIQTQRLFLTQDHPTTTIFHHCVSQLLDPLDIDYHSSFRVDELDRNLTGLQDSVYGNPSCMYPDSTYSILYPDSTPNNDFYRRELIHYLSLQGR